MKSSNNEVARTLFKVLLADDPGAVTSIFQLAEEITTDLKDARAASERMIGELQAFDASMLHSLDAYREHISKITTTLQRKLEARAVDLNESLRLAAAGAARDAIRDTLGNEMRVAIAQNLTSMIETEKTEIIKLTVEAKKAMQQLGEIRALSAEVERAKSQAAKLRNQLDEVNGTVWSRLRNLFA